MNHLALETELRKRIRKRRNIEIILCALLFLFALSFTIAYSQSKVVEVKDLGFMQHQTVTHNTDLLWGVLIGWMFFTPCAIVLICDYIFTRLSTIQVGNYFVTYYRGMAHVNFYVDGEYKDGLTLFGYYLEFSLPDGTKVNAALGKYSTHLSFSGGYPSVDL